MSKKATSAKTQRKAKAAGKAAIATTQAMAFANTVINQLDALNAHRVEWEATDFKKANDGLYDLLSQCLAVFEQQFLHAQVLQKKELRSTLVARLNAAGIRTVKTSHTLTMLVRYVFQSDRNRAHGYATVLIAAIEQGKTSAELASWITEKGGVEQIKRERKPKTTEQLAKQARLEAATAEVQSAIQSAAHVPLATVDMQGLTGIYAILLAKPNVNGGADIVGTLSNVSEALYAALLKQMSEQQVKNAEELALLDKEGADLLGAHEQDAQSKAIAG
jgi:hypothetical protein